VLKVREKSCMGSGTLRFWRGKLALGWAAPTDCCRHIFDQHSLQLRSTGAIDINFPSEDATRRTIVKHYRQGPAPFSEEPMVLISLHTAYWRTSFGT
jgi:hypothetical protein